MQLRPLIVALLVARSAGRTLTVYSAGETAEERAQVRAFWAKEWRAVASELAQLREAAEVMLPNAAMLQLSATPKAEKVPAPPKPAKLDIKELAGLGRLAAEKSDPATLAPMLAMLKGLYEGARKRVGGLNKQEKESKERATAKEKHHKENLAHFDAEYKAGKISLEFYNNSTRDENRMYNYWPRCREREHKQYHNMLKLQHATMEKEKAMIDMYEKTIAGHQTKEVEKKLRQLTGQAPPEVVLAQTVSRFCDDSLVQVAAATNELLTERA